MADASEPEAPALHPTTPDGPVHRIARAPSPWSWPDWANVGSDGTFGNRWDDPGGVYRVLYAAGSRLGAFVEVLARFRPDPELVAELAEIADEGEAAALPGELDASWLENRVIGVARFHGEFAEIGHSSSLAHIRRALAPRVVHYGIEDLDASAIRLSVPRRFTQEISRYVYDRSTPAGQRRFAGIAYRSKLGDEFRNWALFEPARDEDPPADEAEPRPLEAEDPDLNQALALLGVRLVGR